VAKDDGHVNCDEVGSTRKQRHAVHDVQRQPTQSKHGQHHSEPLGRSNFCFPRQLPHRISRCRLLLLLLLLVLVPTVL